MNIKKSLRKDLECTTCRNMRISKEIDFLNSYYDSDLLGGEDPVY